VRPEPRLTARRAIGLEPDLAIACYTGKLTEDHNEFLLAAAAEAARRINGFRLLLVGGNAAILDWTRRRAAEMDLGTSVILTGFVAPAEIGRYQSAADVLVYHMPESVGIFPYTTPAKAYEYQAMRRPIVATDFPLFEEVFGADGERALCVKHRTPDDFATGIASAMALPDGGRAMTERAASFIRGRTWAERSAAILSALEL
jgi:glycosyltransferase involved in cell wall biosynthesis